MKPQFFLVTLVLAIQALFVFNPAVTLAQGGSVIKNVIDTDTTPENKLPKYDKGVDQSIQDYLCTPTGLGTDLFTCVSRLYRFSIAFGSIALVFFIVYAGYLYITGGETGKKKGKDVILSAFTGMAIIVFSFVLLRFINPALTEIRPIQPPIFKSVDLPSCEDIGFQANCIITQGPNAGQVVAGDGKAYGGRGCKPITNDNSPASINNLKKTCWGKYGDTVVKNASIVAANETGGRPIAVYENSCGAGRQPARCVGGEIPVYGVFQINLMAWKIPDGKGGMLDCPKAFAPQSNSFCSTRCRVTNKDLYNRCFEAVKNIQNEFEVACHIYEVNNNRQPRPGWHAWGNKPNEHASKCGF